MQNRNFLKSAHKRPASNLKIDTDSFQISHSKNYNFLEDNFSQVNHSSLQSPIMKMKFELSPDMSRHDTLNYSSNNYIQEQPSKMVHKSYAQSPEKENKFETKLNYLAAKKYSIPDARMMTQVFQKEKNENVLKNYGSNEFVKPLRKLNGKRNGFRADNEQEFEQKYQNEPVQFYSQKLIENNDSQEQSEKYMKLARKFQELERELENMRQQNMRLKRSKQELMNENLQIKRKSSGQLKVYSNEIEQLKEQIYRMEMERQQIPMGRTGNTTRLGFSRENSMLSARGGFSQQMDAGNVNMFYVEELEKQNEQLVRENRRLNEIVMKRLKHSIAE